MAQVKPRYKWSLRDKWWALIDRGVGDKWPFIINPKDVYGVSRYHAGARRV